MSPNTPIKSTKKPKLTPVIQPSVPMQAPLTRAYNLLFWNVLHKDLSSIVENIANYHKADFILLAELNKNDTKKYQDVLQSHGYFLRATSSSKVKIFDRLTNSQSTLVKASGNFSQEDRLTSIVYTINGERILLVGIHLFSIAAMSQPRSRRGFASLALKVVEELEINHSIDKTIIIGDFNLNPYEQGMTDFFGLHATMCKNTAQLGERDIAGEKKRYFFNPSWQAYSNVGTTDAPPGTYYYSDRYDTTLPYWNMLDQVIIRPELVPNSMGFKIITHGGAEIPTLLNDELKPDKEAFSDHLPILYTIKF